MALHTLIAQIHALDPLTVRATIVLGNSNWQKKNKEKTTREHKLNASVILGSIKRFSFYICPVMYAALKPYIYIYCWPTTNNQFDLVSPCVNGCSIAVARTMQLCSIRFFFCLYFSLFYFSFSVFEPTPWKTEGGTLMWQCFAPVLAVLF